MSDEAVPTVAPVTPRDELLTVTGTLVGHYHLTYTSGMLIELDLELDAEDYDNEQRIEAIRDISMCSRDGKALAYAGTKEVANWASREHNQGFRMLFEMRVRDLSAGTYVTIESVREAGR